MVRVQGLSVQGQPSCVGILGSLGYFRDGALGCCVQFRDVRAAGTSQSISQSNNQSINLGLQEFWLRRNP